MESFTWIQQELSRRTGHLVRGFQRWNPRMIYDLRVNIFTQLKVHRLERSALVQVVYHKWKALHGSNKNGRVGQVISSADSDTGIRG